MTQVNAVVIAAQEEEITPLLEIVTGVAPQRQATTSPLWNAANRVADVAAPIGRIRIASGKLGKVVVAQTGIGIVATSAVLSWLLAAYKPRFVISIGSAGGLHPEARVLDLVAGSTYAYGTADATAFGYAPGQVPRQPVTFAGDAALLGALPEGVRVAPMISADSFVTAANVGQMRETFPDAFTTDMESTAAAQVCTMWGAAFVSLRCVSDLCGPTADQDYHVALEDAAFASALAATHLLMRLAERRIHGRAPIFGRPAIDSALLLVLARSHRLRPAEDHTGVPDEILTATRQQLTEHPSFIKEALGLVAAAHAAIKADPTLTLTAKAYDTERSRLVAQLGVASDRGVTSWPPTSQTVSKRSNGYWNDALANLGIRVKSGRQRGTVKFTGDDYHVAMSDFVAWAENAHITPSVSAYNRWLDDQPHGSRPSSAAVRQHYATWRKAVAIQEH